MATSTVMNFEKTRKKNTIPFYPAVATREATRSSFEGSHAGKIIWLETLLHENEAEDLRSSPN